MDVTSGGWELLAYAVIGGALVGAVIYGYKRYVSKKGKDSPRK